MIHLHTDIYTNELFKLHSSDFRVLFLLLKHQDNQHDLFIAISQTQIAKQLGMTQCNVNKCLHKLLKLGIVTEIGRVKIVLNSSLIIDNKFS
jgi:predicted transcriptional regulator